MRRAAPVVPMLPALSACRTPDIWYSVPPQTHLQEPRPEPIRSFIRMNDPDADSYLAKEISPYLESGAWRWTGPQPARPLLARWRFALPQIGFSRTGPVTVCFSVNGHELDTRRYDGAGEQQFEKPVPAEWLIAAGLAAR